MTLIPITLHGRLVAVADQACYYPDPDLDPYELRWVAFMSFYAIDILNGRYPGPYCDDDARAYARAALIPQELLERPDLNIEHTAAALRVPSRELAAACDEHMLNRAAPINHRDAHHHQP